MYRELLIAVGMAGNVIFYAGMNVTEIKAVQYFFTHNYVQREQVKESACTTAKATGLGFALACAAALQLKRHDDLEEKIE